MRIKTQLWLSLPFILTACKPLNTAPITAGTKSFVEALYVTDPMIENRGRS